MLFVLLFLHSFYHCDHLVGKQGACLCVSRAFVCLFARVSFSPLFSSSCCRGLAAVCDCGISWTFLSTFYRRPVAYARNKCAKHNSGTTQRYNLKMTMYGHQMEMKRFTLFNVESNLTVLFYHITMSPIWVKNQDYNNRLRMFFTYFFSKYITAYSGITF